MSPIDVLPWRLGLGWLFGRRRILLTTADRDHPGGWRTAHPFAQQAGVFFLPVPDGEPRWWANLRAQPAATIQAWPGPRSIEAREATADEEQAIADLWRRRGTAQLADLPPGWIVLEPTGQRTPTMTPPDLVWVWAIAAAALLVAWARR